MVRDQNMPATLPMKASEKQSITQMESDAPTAKAYLTMPNTALLPVGAWLDYGTPI
jgi:hypothetical protein